MRHGKKYARYGKENNMCDKEKIHSINPITGLDTEPSEWVGVLFGGNFQNGMIWRPEKGKHPNWFWRWMQYICFGNRWIKIK